MGRKNTEADFWAKVDVRGPDECWPWKGCLCDGGYGKGMAISGKTKSPHRWAWYFSNVVDAGDLFVCQHCDNPKCCNPDHLFAGTPMDNMLDAMRKGRLPSGDNHYRRIHPELIPRGEDNGRAKLTVDQVIAIRKSTMVQQKLADMLMVTQATISSIKARKTLAHIK